MLGAIIAGTLPPKPMDTPNNLQSNMTAASGVLNNDNSNDEADDDADVENISSKNKSKVVNSKTSGLLRKRAVTTLTTMHPMEVNHLRERTMILMI